MLAQYTLIYLSFSFLTLLFFTGSTVNLTNSIIGSGILGLPYAFSACGWYLGVTLILLAGMATSYSLHMLSLCSLKVEQPASFYKVAQASIPRFTFLIDAAVASMTFGVGVSYLIVIGGLMPDVAKYLEWGSFMETRYIWVTFGFCIVGPMSCLKTLDALKYTSAAAVFFVRFIALRIFSYAVDEDINPCDDDGNDCVGNYSDGQVNISTFKVLGVFIFAYTCQMNMFPVVNELKNPTIKRFDTVSSSAILCAGSMYLLVSLSGYSVYGNEVDPNVLISFPDTPATTVARIFTSLLVAFSYPLLCVPGRTSMMSLLAMYDPPEFELTKEKQHFRFYMFTAFFLFGSYALAMITSNLGVVLALIGATGSTIITYILPGAAFYVLYPAGEVAEWKRKLAYGYVVFGCIIMPFCLAFIFVPE